MKKHNDHPGAQATNQASTKTRACEQAVHTCAQPRGLLCLCYRLACSGHYVHRWLGKTFGSVLLLHCSVDKRSSAWACALLASCLLCTKQEKTRREGDKETRGEKAKRARRKGQHVMHDVHVSTWHTRGEKMSLTTRPCHCLH